MYFIHIVEEGNLSKAADKLYISQPALSKYLSKLESIVGSQLVVRNGAFISLTKEGKIYYETAIKCCSLLNSAEKQMEDLSEVTPKTLVIGTSGDRSQGKMGEFIAPLFEAFPQLHIKLVEDSASVLIKKIKQGDIDIGFMSPGIIDSELEYITLFTTVVQLAVPRNHKLALAHPDGTILDIKTFKDERFALPGKKTNFRKKIDAYLQNAKVNVNVAIETKSKYSALKYVEAGNAIGFYPKHYASSSKDIVFLDIKDAFSYSQAILFKKNAYLSKPAKMFIDLASAYYKAHEETL